MRLYVLIRGPHRVTMGLLADPGEVNPFVVLLREKTALRDRTKMARRK